MAELRQCELVHTPSGITRCLCFFSCDKLRLRSSLRRSVAFQVVGCAVTGRGPRPLTSGTARARLEGGNLDNLAGEPRMRWTTYNRQLDKLRAADGVADERLRRVLINAQMSGFGG
jgi:hypothetical protein